MNNEKTDYLGFWGVLHLHFRNFIESDNASDDIASEENEMRKQTLFLQKKWK